MRRLVTGMWVSVLLVLLLSVCVSSASASGEFGVSTFSLQPTVVKETPEEVEGKPDIHGKSLFSNLEEPFLFTQAGGHPFSLTTTIIFNRETELVHGGTEEHHHLIGGDPKDIVVELPPGLLADPLAVPRCPIAIFDRGEAACPAGSQIGIIEIFFSSVRIVTGIYNLVPEAGQSAEFGIPSGGTFDFLLTAHLVHTAAGYGFTVTSNNVPERNISEYRLTFWGVPAESSHDPERGRRCERNEIGPTYCSPPDGLHNPGGEQAGVEPVPFLVMPTDCTGGVGRVRVLVDSWQDPGVFREGPVSTLPAPTGCDGLSFEPSIEVRPDTKQADSPVGLSVRLKVPQTEEPGVARTPDLRNAVVTLPPGLSIDPGVVDGVQACNETGPEGIDLRTDLNHKQEPLRAGELDEGEKLGPSGEPQLEAGHCPDASIVGTAEAITPLLPEPIRGHLYLARPLCGGAGDPACTEEDAHDGRLYRLYMELGGEGALANTGINIKLAGTVSVDLATGQLSSSFVNNPQAPFSELILHLNGGPRAPLANPQACGEARTTTDFTPWSAPGLTHEGLLVPGTADANPLSFYTVTGCSSPPGLNPGFSAGTVTPEAGVFTPFTMNLTRHDGEQDLAGIQIHTPPGLLGMLSSVPLCEEPLAGTGHCPESSRIGTTRVASGAGSHPFEIGGNVYLTTSYKGAPFGLSIVTDAVAGPFNLGLVVVRARIDVNPETSELTVTSDPLPQIVFGVPLRLQRVTVNIDRPGFMFNPTNCNAMSITAAVSGNQNAVANVSSPFAVGACKSLAFKPSFSVSTTGRTSRKSGASLDAKLSYPPFKAGSEANIARVKVSLPKQLPSYLPTLQKACLAQTFDTNPAACPAGSIVGIAKATTPLLPVGLAGPVYFISHGGEAFPSLIIVLQGDGVRVDLTGSTFISKAGITSTTFKTVPDVPVGTFELYLPQGANHALAANTNLCKASKTLRTRVIKKRVHGKTVRVKTKTRTGGLTMPTEFVAQNGMVLRQTTKIAVTGCNRNKKRSGR